MSDPVHDVPRPTHKSKMVPRVCGHGTVFTDHTTGDRGFYCPTCGEETIVNARSVVSYTTRLGHPSPVGDQK